MIKVILPILTIGAMILLVNYTPVTAPLHKLEKIAKKINNTKNSTWQASKTLSKFYKRENLSKMFNLKIEENYPKNFENRPKSLKTEKLPKNFDAREKWPQCTSIAEVRDQSACGSCWAFGAATAMSDRLCISSVKKIKENSKIKSDFVGELDLRRVSTEDLMECCDDCGFGCGGGWLYQSWAYFKENGLVTGDLYADGLTCKPYAFPPCNHHSHNPDRDDCSKNDFSSPSCKYKCSNDQYENSYQDDLIKGTSVYGVRGEEEMMKELIENGPIEAAFEVYEDFLTYKKGVYQHLEGSLLGGHAIRILGYGVEDDVKYWLCANSWNEDWGDNGFFKILRGDDHCGIENSGVAGIV